MSRPDRSSLSSALDVVAVDFDDDDGGHRIEDRALDVQERAAVARS